jgi:hypothetical protein
MATVYGFWDRYEPRPPEHEIDADLLDLSRWLAEQVEGMNPADIDKVAHFAGVTGAWPEGSVVRTPDERFQNLPAFPYEPKYVEVENLRMAYVDEQARGDGSEFMIMLHGEPKWGVLVSGITYSRADARPILSSHCDEHRHRRWSRTE